VDEVEMNNDCFRNLHLISHFVTASPQGEAFEKTYFFVPNLTKS